MDKFAIGEKVWVKPFEEIKNKREHSVSPEDPGFTEEMNQFCGKKITINGDFGDQLYSACGWTWDEDWLESEEEHNERIKPKPKFRVGQIVYLKPLEEVAFIDRLWIGEATVQKNKNTEFIVENVATRDGTRCYAYDLKYIDDDGDIKTKKVVEEASLETEVEHRKRFKELKPCKLTYSKIKERYESHKEYYNEALKEQAWAYSAATNADVKLCDNHTGELVKTFKVTGNGEIQEEKHVRFEDLPEKGQKALMEMIKRVNTVFEGKQEVTEMNYTPKRVIFNNPAVVVFWKDGTKTTAQAHNETFDPEKGLAVCFAKKALGNGYEGSTAFAKLMKKWLPKEKQEEDKGPKVNPAIELVEKLNQMEKDGIVLSRVKIYKFDDGSIVKYSKKIETWVVSLDKKA